MDLNKDWRCATSHLPLINPGPAETPGSNDRRVGAPNHHQNTGSGENTMVGTIRPADQAPDPTLAVFVGARLNSQTHRYVTATSAGLAVNVADLAVLVTEIVAEYADRITAERDALAEDLAWELNPRHTSDVTGNNGGRAA